MASQVPEANQHSTSLSNDWHIILELKLHEDVPEAITKAKVNQLGKETFEINIGTTATPCCFRLIDCRALIEHWVLKLWEFRPDIQGLPNLDYSVISYIWRGLGCTESTRSLHVEGTDINNLISIDVLRTACLASLDEDFPGLYWGYTEQKSIRCEYMWLDQLCIIQKTPPGNGTESNNKKKDKDWQIHQMYHVYAQSKKCLIVPSGLRRLASLDEETAWTQRAWTLQECLAPMNESIFVLFSWNIGNGNSAQIATDPWAMPVYPLDCKNAIAPFKDILKACDFRSMSVGIFPKMGEYKSLEDSVDRIDVKIFGKSHPALTALKEAVENYSAKFTRKRNHALIWYCTFTRTSSRPVDMVFSIMGLMEITLDPTKFEDNDRLEATRTLASLILEKGGSADWLGILPRIKPHPKISTFPDFPETAVDGQAMYGSETIKKLTENDWILPWSVLDKAYSNSSPFSQIQGSMDENGRLSFRRKACIVERIESGDTCDDYYDGNYDEDETDQFPEWHLEDQDGNRWKFLSESDLTVLDASSNLEQTTIAIPLYAFGDHSTDERIGRYQEGHYSGQTRSLYRFVLVRRDQDSISYVDQYATFHYIDKDSDEESKENNKENSEEDNQEGSMEDGEENSQEDSEYSEEEYLTWWESLMTEWQETNFLIGSKKG